jgi:eukaryotic-like serine/threonine-protein kinase
MTLPSGTRLGPYEVLSPLGAGGMGEVYRARDTRLDREVAVKVLPSELSSDAERLKRFEKEARSASSLNHPNIVTIYDIGAEGGVSYIAMEKVEGPTLRALLVGGALPIKKLFHVAPQIAEGLAKAHEAGIVHRDLKPENVMVTRDGLVKILDFGLAKLASRTSGSGEGSHLPTMTATTPGVVVGTVGYMSPEQASGLALDFRSDQFALGSILYEMATGKRAFQKKTAIDTLSAILNEEPEPIGAINPQVPAPLRWIVERCLEKEQEGRYVSTRDLARDLATVRDHVSEASLAGIAPAVGARKGIRVHAAVLGLAFAAAVALGVFASRPLWKARFETHPTLRQVTFRRAGIGKARFGPDGRTIIYSQLSGHGSIELYAAQPGNPESKSLGLPSADLLSVSPSGELAILLEGTREGTLATVPLSGGAPRELLENVASATWDPDGKALAVHVSGRIEYPPGKVLYQPPSGESAIAPSLPIRFSPRGDRILFSAFKGYALGAIGGEATTVDLSGRTSRIAKISWEVAWSPKGDEIWLNEIVGGTTSIYAVTLSGKRRFVASFPGNFALYDVDRDGRVLLSKESIESEMIGGSAGQSVERNLSWLDGSVPADLSADGSLVLFTEDGGGGGGGGGGAVYKRRTDGSPAVRLGEGTALALSPDGKWALASQGPEVRPILLPMGPGQPRALPQSGIALIAGHGSFFPDGNRVIVLGAEPGHEPRLYVLDIETGKARAVGPEAPGHLSFRLSPDGRQLFCSGKGVGYELYDVEGGAGQAIPGLPKDSTPIQWCADGRCLFVQTTDTLPIKVFRLTLSTGRLELWKEFSIPEVGSPTDLYVLPTPDGKSYVYSYRKYAADLFIADGLR